MNANCLCPGRTGRVSSRLLKSVIGFAVVCGLPAFAVSANEPADASGSSSSQPGRVQVAEHWHIEVVPGPSCGSSFIPRIERIARGGVEQKNAPVLKEPQNPVDRNKPASIRPASYVEVYHSIPFSRAEYEADPSYRHEATIEFLFGKMRRKVVVQSARPQNAITINNVVSFGPIADYPKTRSKGMWRP